MTGVVAAGLHMCWLSDWASYLKTLVFCVCIVRNPEHPDGGFRLFFVVCST